KKPPRFSLMALYRLVKFILQNDIQIVHSQDLGGLMYASLAKVVTLGRFRLVHTQHSFVHLKKESRYALYEKLFMRLVDDLTVVSSDTAATYVSLGYPEKKIHLIENGVTFPDLPTLSSSSVLRVREALVKTLAPEQA